MKKARPLNAWIDGELKKDQALARRVEKKLDELRIEQQLLRLRKNAGLSQSQLAKKLGVSQPFVAKIESGKVKNFNLTTLSKAADVLGYSLRVSFEPNEHGNGGKRPKSRTRRTA